MSEERDESTASGFVDVVIPPFPWFYDQLRAAVPILLFILPFLAAVILIFEGTGIGSSWGANSELLFAIILGVPIVLFLVWFMRKRLSHVRKIAKQLAAAWPDESDASMIHEALDRRPSGTELHLFQELSKVLALRGFRGRIFRLRYAPTAPTINPFEVSFEPRILDESDATFIELLDAIDSGKGKDAGGMEGIEARDRFVRLSVRRKFKLMDKHWLLIILAFPVLIEAIKSYRHRQVSLTLLVFSFSFLVQLFSFPGSNWKFPHAHFLPGGILMAAASSLPKRKSRLRLMSRDRCVMFVIQRKQSIWEIIVSDGEDVGVARATLAEANVLLRAWLSPVPPPPEEMVVNMVFQNKKEKSNS